MTSAGCITQYNVAYYSTVEFLNQYYVIIIVFPNSFHDIAVEKL